MLIRFWLSAARFCDAAVAVDAAGAGNGGGTPANTQSLPVAKPVQQDANSFAAQIMQAIGPQLATIVQDQIKPIQEQATKLAADLAQATKPVHQKAALLFGGDPGHGGVHSGERASASRGFEFQRALGYQQGMEEFQADGCKVEREFCKDLRSLYRQSGLDMDGVSGPGGREPMLCVLDSSYIPDQFKSTLQQKYGTLPQFMTQGLAGADPDQLRYLAQKHQKYASRINQALSQFDDSGMGVFLEPGPHGEMIEYIRPREALTKAGVRDIALPPNGYLPFGSQTGTSTGYWVGEAGPTTTTQPVTGRKEMRAKKAAALVQIPNELFKFASGTTEAFVRSDVGAVIALLEDKAGLEGTGTSTQPLGVRNLPNVLQHTRTLIVGANGNQFEPRTPSAMIVDVQDRNYDVDNDGWAWIMRAPMWEEVSTRRAVMYSGGGESGPYLFQMQAADLSKGLNYDTLRGYPVIKSGQVSNTLTKGSNSALSYVVGGVWKNCLRGRVGVIEFAMATQGDSLFPNYLSQLRAIDFVDFLYRYETCFAIADKLDMTLPNG